MFGRKLLEFPDVSALAVDKPSIVTRMSLFRPPCVVSIALPPRFRLLVPPTSCTLAVMPDGDIYQIVDRYSRTGRIGYVHFRNVRGTVPRYVEAFVDDGDTDMIRLLRILKRNGYDGVLIPDHTPLMSCNAPWHAGMAFAMGYIRAALQVIEQ